MWGLLRGVIAVAVLAAAMPAGAHAATIGVNYGQGYRAGPGETNDVTVSYTPGSPTATYVVTDAGVASITDVDGPGGCEVSGNQATCALPPGSCAPAFLGDGNDRVTLSSNVPCSELHGDEGDDVIAGGDGKDFITGGGGDDQGSGGGGDDVLREDEALSLGQGNDSFSGGDGNDLVQGSVGNDVLRGGAGDDTVLGDTQFVSDLPPGWENPCAGGCAYNDDVSGDAGNDDVMGGPGDDLVSGGDGNDMLDAGVAGEQLGVEVGMYDGADRLDGGDGTDFLYGRPSTRDDDTSDDLFCGDGPNDVALAGANDVVSTTCEGWVQFVICPESAAGWCEGSISINGTPAAGKRRPKNVALGSGKLKRTTSGEARQVSFLLKRKRVRRVLRHRSETKARAITKTHDKRKKLPTEKTRFTLKR